jgi:hypothetical protein
VALLAAAALAPTAAAARKPKPHVKLALLPLPQNALGAAGASLPLQWQDSGTVTNVDAASRANAPDVSSQHLKKLGRVLGYSLDYGDPYTGAAGVTEIKTTVDEYKTAAGAKRGLAFWRRDVLTVSITDEGAFTLSRSKLEPRRVGQGGFSYLFTEQAPSLSPIYHVVEQAREGRFVMDVDLRAGGREAATRLAPALARKLDTRVRTAIAGRLRGSPVPLKFSIEAGPPPGGPDLSKLVLQPSDFGAQQLQQLRQLYIFAPYAISDYHLDFWPGAGPYDEVVQDLTWYSSATEATQVAAYAGYFEGHLSVFSNGPMTLTATPVDVSSAGDNATAEIANISPTGDPAPFDWVVVTLRKGQVLDQAILFTTGTPPQAAALESIANAMAKRLDAGYAG